MKHGSEYTYKRKGCRCEACKSANAEANRRWVANRAARGDRYVRKDRERAARRACVECGNLTRAKAVRPLCNPCRLAQKRSFYVPSAIRLMIYERDGWLCGFCGEEVNPQEAHNSPGQATLDHILPRSLGGPDDHSNLRLLHRYCNNVRSNRPLLRIEDLAAA